MSKKSNHSPIITLAKKRKAQGVIKGEKVLFFEIRSVYPQSSVKCQITGLSGKRYWSNVCEPELAFRMWRHWLHCVPSRVSALEELVIKPSCVCAMLFFF